MIEITTMSATIAGAVLGLLVTTCVVVLFVGLRARAGARAVLEALSRHRALAAESPAQVMIVRGDGRIELSRRLADWLGFEALPRDLSELVGGDSGLVEEQAGDFVRDVTAAQKGGKPFSRTIRPRGSERLLVVTGMRAPDAVHAPGGVVLWFTDATESQGEISRLQRDTGRLRAAFDALTALIEAAPIPMWYRGPDLRLLMVNSAYVRAVEAVDAEDAVERGLELVEGAGLGGPLANAAMARDTQEPQRVTMPATIGGERRTLRLFDIPLPTGGVAGFAIDVEEVMQARGDLRRFEAAQRAMLDRLSAGVVQFAPDHSLVFYNQPFLRMFSMRREWLADKPEFDRVLERMREANRVPDARDFPAWKAERREWFRMAEPAEESWVLSGTHLRVVAQPLPEGGLLLIFEDRTRQLELQREHGEMQQVRTATLDSLNESVAVFARGRLQLWNRRFRATWGFAEGFLDGHPQIATLVKELTPRLSRAGAAEMIGDLIRSAAKDRQQRGGTIATRDGRQFEVSAVPLPDGNALLTMVDTTDRHRVERALRDRNEALEVADRVKTAFVANMSYELRTPLTSIKGFAEMLDGGYAGTLSDHGREYVGAILDSVDRLGRLIDEVLDLTRNEGAPVAREAVAMDAIAREAVAAVTPVARAKRIDLAVEVQPSAGMVQGETRRLRQAIEHLLRHAIAGTPEEGRVLLHIDGTARRARIIVSDNGPGMSREAVARAFDRFAHTPTGRDGGRGLGLGLGLPLAKQFVEAHGGKIDMLSEQGAGTLVTVDLPRE